MVFSKTTGYKLEMLTDDKVYRYFSSEKEAEEFLCGNLVLRSSYFYEILEYAGDAQTGDSFERTISGSVPDSGASTSKSFMPKYLTCFSNSKDWNQDTVWVEILSSEKLYKLVKEKLSDSFVDQRLIGGTLSCGNVLYLDAAEAHDWNIKRINKQDNENQWKEVKRKKYSPQNEWRIVFEGAKSDGGLLGQVMNIKPETDIGRFITKKKSEIEAHGLMTYDEFLNGFREIKIDLGNLRGIASLCKK